MFQNENNSKFGIGSCLSDIFHIQNGLIQEDSLSRMIINFGLYCAIRRVKENHEELDLNGTY